MLLIVLILILTVFRPAYAIKHFSPSTNLASLVSHDPKDRKAGVGQAGALQAGEQQAGEGHAGKGDNVLVVTSATLAARDPRWPHPSGQTEPGENPNIPETLQTESSVPSEDLEERFRRMLEVQ